MSEKTDFDDDLILSSLTESDFELPNLDDDFDIKKEIREDDDVYDEALVPGLLKRKSKEVLITIDNERKKIITLEDGDDIERKFLESIKRDPVLKDIVRNSHVVFQVFSFKFNTWVDLDKTKDICDGANLKAHFCSKTVERKKHKRKKSKKRRSVDRDSDSSVAASHKSHKRSKSSKHKDTEKYNIPQSSKSSVKYVEQCTSTMDSEHHETWTKPVEQSTLHYKKQSYSSENLCAEGNSAFVKTFRTCGSSDSLLPATEGDVYRLSLGLEKKNPVTALHELCQALKWQKPVFDIVQESLLPSYIMKVTVQGRTFIPEKPSIKKKLAKTAAAELCLKTLGVLK